MTFNELNSAEHYIVHQLNGVNLDARENIEAMPAKSKDFNQSDILKNKTLLTQ